MRAGGDDGDAQFSDACKRDAVAQITGRDYPVAQVFEWFGVLAHLLYVCTMSARSGGDLLPDLRGAADKAGWGS